MNLPWSRHSFVNRKTHACLLVQSDVIKPESRLYNLYRSATRQKESAWRLQKISSKEKLHLRSYDRAKLFSISGTLQLDTPAPTSHTMPSLWVFKVNKGSQVATFDMTQITSSLDRDPFIIMFKTITAPAEIVR